MLIAAHNAKGKIQIQIVGNGVIGHFPGKSNAGTDVAKQWKTVFQAGIFVKSYENLLDEMMELVQKPILHRVLDDYLISNLSLNVTSWECICCVSKMILHRSIDCLCHSSSAENPSDFCYFAIA